MPNWWKCKIVKASTMIPFAKGEIIFAKDGEKCLTLFDGWQGSRVPKAALRHLLLVSRLQTQDSQRPQQDYERKMVDQAEGGFPNFSG